MPQRGAPPKEFVIVGVLRDTLTRGLTDEPDLILYRPLTPDDLRMQSVVLSKSRVPLSRANEIVAQAFFELDPTLPSSRAELLTSWIDRGQSSTRLFASVLSLLGGVGLLLAAIASDVARLVLRQAASTSAMGVVGGLALAYWGSELITAYLVLVVFIAAARPAWTATRVNPIEILRES